jgi:hypothetical protein
LEQVEYTSQAYCEDGAKQALTQFYNHVKDATIASEAKRH